MFQWFVCARVCAQAHILACVSLCTCTPGWVLAHVHPCMRWCVSGCNWGVGRLVGGVCPFFKHSRVVMVAAALMSPKPPTKRFPTRAPDSREANDFQTGRPPHQSKVGQPLCVCVLVIKSVLVEAINNLIFILASTIKQKKKKSVKADFFSPFVDGVV